MLIITTNETIRMIIVDNKFMIPYFEFTGGKANVVFM